MDMLMESFITFLNVDGVKELILITYLISTAIGLFILALLSHTRVFKIKPAKEHKLLCGIIVTIVVIHFAIYLI